MCRNHGRKVSIIHDPSDIVIHKIKRNLYALYIYNRKTSSIIPLCHPLFLEKVNIDIQLSQNQIIIQCHCSVNHKTGVEMEALVGCSVAALTIYDMLKAISHQVKIEETKLLHKSGGKRNVNLV